MRPVTLAAVFTGILAAAGAPTAISGCACPTGGWAVDTVKLLDASTDGDCAPCGDDAGPEACDEITTDAGPALLCHFGESLGSCGGAGRRPAGLRLRPERCARSVTGAYFARMAFLEAAAVEAFTVMARELREHGAPASLVRRAEAAARDEVRHARVVASLSQRFGGSPRTPRRASPRARSLARIARENMVEGCVRETWAALVARHQADAATDPRIRAAMARIARDELRHAALSWDVAGWAERQLGPAARRRIAAARGRAVEQLGRSAADVPEELVRVAGLPGGELAARLAEGLRRALFS